MRLVNGLGHVLVEGGVYYRPHYSDGPGDCIVRINRIFFDTYEEERLFPRPPNGKVSRTFHYTGAKPLLPVDPAWLGRIYSDLVRAIEAYKRFAENNDD